MSRKLQCFGCAEIVELAWVCRSVNEHRYLVFCPTCGRSFTRAENWITLRPEIATKAIQCIGCDKGVFTAAANMAPKVPLVFCFGCREKMLVESRWEECRRGGEDGYDEYAPRVIVPGRIVGGH